MCRGAPYANAGGMTIQHEYLAMALHREKARDYEAEAAASRLAREALAARRASAARTPWWRRLFPAAGPRRTASASDCRPAVAR